MGTIFQFDPTSQQVSLVSASGYSPGSQIVIGADLGLYLVEYTPSGAVLARYGTDGSGPQALFDFSPTIDPSPWSTLSAVGNDLYVGGFDPYYQVNVSTQVLTGISVPAHSASFSPLGNLTETAGGELIGVWPSTSQSPFFGELIQYSGGYPKPPPVVFGFFPRRLRPAARHDPWELFRRNLGGHRCREPRYLHCEGLRSNPVCGPCRPNQWRDFGH